MEQVSINTTQNVTLNYSAAGIGPRILAGLLDSIFTTAYIVIIAFIFGLIAQIDLFSSETRSEDEGLVAIAIFILLMLPAMLYHLLCETFFNGQSFGKMIVRIKVVKIDGTQPSFGSYLIRSMFRLIDVSLFSPMLAMITIAVSNRSQRFGDMVAGTTVILMNRKVTLRETILHMQKPDYKIVYPQVSLLSDTDANIIREVLDFSYRQNQPKHVSMLSKKIKTKYGISEVKQDDASFLNTLLMDYTNYQFEK